MKKNDWILLSSVLLYSILFYQQSAGINFLIFTIALIVGLLLRNVKLVHALSWKMAAIGSLCSAFCLAYYGSTLALVANIISLSVLSGLSLSQQSSIIFSLLFSAYSYITSMVFMYLDWADRRANTNKDTGTGYFKKSLLIAIPILVTLLFFQLYRISNPLFNEFTAKINFNFISLNWVGFSLTGFVLLYGFYYHKQVTEWAAFDESGKLSLVPQTHQAYHFLGKEIQINDENFSGKVMFLLLNVLLLLVNALDFNFIFIDQQLPQGMSYSEFVHQGTGTVITSIVVAIGIILFYFRGALNFYEQSKSIKILAYCWIFQNILLLVSTAFRNELYIEAYGLTYKRIGVYVYLLMAAIGLLTTFIKIFKLKSNHFLFRTNGWMFYAVLVLACFINWDLVIANYNINIAHKIEKGYLVKLSDKVLPSLYELEQNKTLQQKVFTHDAYVRYDNYDGSYEMTPSSYEQELSRKLYHFMESINTQGWQSWYFHQTQTYQALKKLDEQNKLENIDLTGTLNKSLAPFREFKNIQSFTLVGTKIGLSELSYFPSIKHLEMQHTHLTSLTGIHALQHVSYLDISHNQIEDYSPLLELHSLQTLKMDKAVHPSIIEQLQSKFPGIQIVLI